MLKSHPKVRTQTAVYPRVKDDLQGAGVDDTCLGVMLSLTNSRPSLLANVSLIFIFVLSFSGHEYTVGLLE